MEFLKATPETTSPDASENPVHANAAQLPAAVHFATVVVATCDLQQPDAGDVEDVVPAVAASFDRRGPLPPPPSVSVRILSTPAPCTPARSASFEGSPNVRF